jgi:hypothetical protein
MLGLLAFNSVILVAAQATIKNQLVRRFGIAKTGSLVLPPETWNSPGIERNNLCFMNFLICVGLANGPH